MVSRNDEIIVVKTPVIQPMCNCGGYTPPPEDIIWFLEGRNDIQNEFPTRATVLYGNEQQNDYKSASSSVLPDNWFPTSNIVQDYQRRAWFTAIEYANEERTELADAYLIRAELKSDRTVELKWVKLPRINAEILGAGGGSSNNYVTVDKNGNVYISFQSANVFDFSTGSYYLAMMKATPISETAFTFNIIVDVQSSSPQSTYPPPDLGKYITFNYAQDRVANFSVFGNRVAVWNTLDLSFIGYINTPLIYDGTYATGMPTDISNSPNKGLTYIVDSSLDDQAATAKVYAISLDTMAIINTTIIQLMGEGGIYPTPGTHSNSLLAFPDTVDMKGRLIMGYNVFSFLPQHSDWYVAYADPIGNGQVAQPLFQHIATGFGFNGDVTHKTNFVTKPSANQKMVYAWTSNIFPTVTPPPYYPTFGGVVFVSPLPSPEEQLEIYKITNPWETAGNVNEGGIAWLRE